VRILFIPPARAGDAILSTGLLDHLIRSHAHAKVVVACDPGVEGVFARMPNRAWTIVLPRRLPWLALWREAAGQRWDILVNLRGGGLGWAIRARRRHTLRAGTGSPAARYGALLGLDPPPGPVAWFGATERARAAALLPGGPWIGLAAAAWPADRVAALVAALVAPGAVLAGARVAVLDGPALPEAAVDLTGSLAVPDAAAVLARCALVIGDAAPLAAAVGTPALALDGLDGLDAALAAAAALLHPAPAPA